MGQEGQGGERWQGPEVQVIQGCMGARGPGGLGGSDGRGGGPREAGGPGGAGKEWRGRWAWAC